jgi:hypothetical protein
MVNKKAIATQATKEFDIQGMISVDDQGFITIDGDVVVDGNYQNHELPLHFNIVTGSFKIRPQTLTTLKGCPLHVKGDFDCSANSLESLEGSPKKVGGYFDARFCNLKTLEGGPLTVGGNYFARRNEELISLKGIAQTIGGEFDVTYSPDLGLLPTLLAKNVEIMTGGLSTVNKINEILNKHCGQTPATFKKAAFLCAYELTKAGFASNAKL